MEHHFSTGVDTPFPSADDFCRDADQFPAFANADVKINITQFCRYKLHGAVLRSQSSFFAKHVTPANAAKLSTKAKSRGIKTIHHFRLFNDISSSESPEMKLVAVKLDREGREVVGDEEDLCRIETCYTLPSGRMIPDEVELIETQAWHQVLGAFYNVPIHLGDPLKDDLMTLLNKAMAVVDIAEYLDVIHLVHNSIEATFLALGQDLYRCIANKPCPWLQLAFRIASRPIFREALIHAVGQCNTFEVENALEDPGLDKSIKHLIHTKGDSLIAGIVEAERRINSYFPAQMMREKTFGLASKDNIGRSSYGNDIIAWIATVALRQYLTDSLIREEGHISQDLGFALFSRIAQGGEAYLTMAEMQEFHNHFPMSRKGMACVEHRLLELKEGLKTHVEPFLHNSAQLDIRKYPVKYFTCLNVKNMRFPFDADFEREGQADGDQQMSGERGEDETISSSPLAAGDETLSDNLFSQEDGMSEDEGDDWSELARPGLGSSEQLRIKWTSSPME